MEQVDDLSIYGSASAQLLDQVLGFNVHFVQGRDVFVDASTGWEDLGVATFLDPEITSCGKWLIFAVIAVVLAMVVVPVSLKGTVMILLMIMGYTVGLMRFHRVVRQVSDANLQFTIASGVCFIHGGLASISASNHCIFWPLFAISVLLLVNAIYWWQYSRCCLDQRLLMVANVMMAVIYPLQKVSPFR